LAWRGRRLRLRIGRSRTAAQNLAKTALPRGIGELPEDPTKSLILHGLREAAEDHRSDHREHLGQYIGADPRRARSPQGNLFAGAVRAKDLAKNIAALLCGGEVLRGSRIGEGRQMLALSQRANEGPDPKRMLSLFQESFGQSRHDGFDRRVCLFSRDVELCRQIIDGLAALGITQNLVKIEHNSPPHMAREAGRPE
jgi:hypothetical protein